MFDKFIKCSMIIIGIMFIIGIIIMSIKKPKLEIPKVEDHASITIPIKRGIS